MRRLLRLVRLGSRLLGVTAVTVALLALLGIGLGPPTGAYQVRTVLTGSMRPTMPEGSVVMIRPVRPAQLRVDDVITYRIPVEDRRIVTHRIVEIVEPGTEPVVRTQGDANNAPDPWVARLRGDDAWRVRLSVPKVGYVLAALRQPAARQLTVLAAPALLALVSVVRIWVPPKAEERPAEADEAKAPAPRQRAKEPRPQPAPRELSDQERWQEWRERRVLQRPGGRRIDDGHRPYPPQGAEEPPPQPVPRQPTEERLWEEWRELIRQHSVERGLDA